MRHRRRAWTVGFEAGEVPLCAWLEDDRLAEAFKGLVQAEAGLLKEVAVTVGRVAQQVAPIVTAVPIPQAQIIDDFTVLIGDVFAEAIDALADEWRVG
jgi:hypothetical protein